jgi:hypothetical protein
LAALVQVAAAAATVATAVLPGGSLTWPQSTFGPQHCYHNLLLLLPAAAAAAGSPGGALTWLHSTLGRSIGARAVSGLHSHALQVIEQAAARVMYGNAVQKRRIFKTFMAWCCWSLLDLGPSVFAICRSKKLC